MISRHDRRGADRLRFEQQILDIKTVMQEFLPRSPVRQPEWASELMPRYWFETGPRSDE